MSVTVGSLRRHVLKFCREFGPALAIGIAVLLLLLTAAWRYLLNRALDEFASASAHEQELITQRLIAADEFLGGIASYLDVVNVPDAALFRNYLAEAMARQTYITTAYYLPKVDAKYRARFEREIVTSGYHNFQIQEMQAKKFAVAAKRNSYYPILLIEPFSPLSVRWLGYDIGSNPAFTAAVERSVQEAVVSASAVTTLTGDKPSLWLFRAIYAGRDIPRDAATRSAYVNGLAALQISVETLLPADAGMSITIDSSLAVTPANHDGAADALMPWNLQQLSTSRQIIRPGYQFTLHFSKTVSLQQIGWLPLLLNALLGLAINTLLLLNASNSKRKKESLSALRESERRLSTLMSNLPGMAYRREPGPGWHMQFVSEGCAALTGYSPEQLTLGKAVSYAWVIHADERHTVDEAIATAVEQSRPYRLNYRIVTASGETKWVFEHGRAVYSAPQDQLLLEGFIMDISERKHAEDEVRVLNEELEMRVNQRTIELQDANRELEAFSYSVSHDLRAPLRHFGAYLKLLEEHLGSQFDSDAHHYFSTLMRASSHMSALINDLLKFAHLAKEEMRLRPVDLNVMVADVIDSMQTDIGSRAINWQIAKLPIVQADAGLIRLVWTNLVSNALKYTRQRTRADIAITVAETANDWQFAIRDNGAGFDMAFRDKLFGVFQRLHPKESFEGTGIGLANVRRIVVRHGGKVDAIGAVDQGATISFTLPKRDGGS